MGDEYVSKDLCKATRDAIIGTQKIQLSKMEGLEKEQKNQTGKIESLTGSVHDMRGEFRSQFARINGKAEGIRQAETTGETKSRKRRDMLNIAARWIGLALIVGGLVFGAGKFVGSMVEGAVEKAVKVKAHEGGGE